MRRGGFFNARAVHDEIERALFYFRENTGDVFADHPQPHDLDAAQHQHGDHDGGEAGGIHPEDQRIDGQIKQIQQRNARNDEADERPDAQRRAAE